MEEKFGPLFCCFLLSSILFLRCNILSSDNSVCFFVKSFVSLKSFFHLMSVYKDIQLKWCLQCLMNITRSIRNEIRSLFSFHTSICSNLKFDTNVISFSLFAFYIPSLSEITSAENFKRQSSQVESREQWLSTFEILVEHSPPLK